MQTTQTCPHCAQEIAQATGENPPRFCTHCGKTLSDPIPSESFQKIDPNPPALATKDYVLMFLLLCVPFVNIAVLIYWAIDQNQNPNRRNFSKAALIYMGICIAISMLSLILVFVAFGFVFEQIFDTYRYHYRPGTYSIPIFINGNALSFTFGF